VDSAKSGHLTLSARLMVQGPSKGGSSA
jgi:hypothetical protein